MKRSYVVELLSPRPPSGARTVEQRWEYPTKLQGAAGFVIAIDSNPEREIHFDAKEGVCRASLGSYHGERE